MKPTYARLPAIVNGYPLEQDGTSWFSVVVPLARTNLISNPSVETGTTGYTAVGGSIAQSSVQQAHGAYSLAVTPTAATSDGVYYGTVSLTSGTPYVASVDVRGQAGVSYKLAFATTGGAVLAAKVFTATGRWQRVRVHYKETSSTTRRIYVTKSASASTAVFYIDGLQCEDCSDGVLSDTTYIDGDQQGLVPNQYPPAYGWNGTPHASTSYRTALTRAGGYIVPLNTYAFLLTAIIGLGSATPLNVALPYTQLDGAQYIRTTIGPRTFSLVGRFEGTTPGALDRARAGLSAILARDKVALQQPLILRYQKSERGRPASDAALIPAVYSGGLEGTSDNLHAETAPISFTTYMPFLQGETEQGAAITVQTTIANANAIIQRANTGNWSALSTGMSGGTPSVAALVVGPDGSLYAGGNYTAAGGVANTAYIAKWDGSAWSALATGMNGMVSALVFGPDGTLYAGGAFSLASGVANTSNIAKWNGSAWSALGTGTAGAGNVLALAVGQDGTLYAGGDFTSMDGKANTAGIAKWNGSAWSAVGTGVTSGTIAVYGMAVGPDGTIYAGGGFSGMGGVANTAKLAKWNGSAWSAMSTGLTGGNYVLALAAAPDGRIYIGGQFTALGGVSVAGIAAWNGVTYTPLGTGLVGSVATAYALAVDAVGRLYVGGDFNSVGGVTLPDRAAVWFNGAWGALDVDLPGTAVVQSVAARGDGSVVLGYNTTGSAVAAAVTSSVTNAGTVKSYPTITIKGPSSGTARIYEIANPTTGRMIYLNYTINAGETATFRFQPDNLSFTSDFQGNLASKILPGSSSADFFLAPGANSLSFYTAGSTVTAIVSWRPQYERLDDLTL